VIIVCRSPTVKASMGWSKNNVFGLVIGPSSPRLVQVMPIIVYVI
jgi:hypothetical protein